MGDGVTRALISFGSVVLLAMTSMALNYRRFTSTKARALPARLGANGRLSPLPSDFKDLNGYMTTLEIAIALWPL